MGLSRMDIPETLTIFGTRHTVPLFQL